MQIQTQIAEYSQTAAALGELRQRYENVVFPVKTTAGMKDAIAARKELRDIRVGLEKMRKEIKAPALLRCQLIDSEAKTITAQLVALEDPIDGQIKAEEARKEREKQERERIERERVERIQAKITGIRSLPMAMTGQPAAEIAAEIEALEGFAPGAEFAEFVGAADAAKASALDALRAMHERQVAQEAEAARLAAERAELERLRAEAAERQRQEEARLAAERKAQEDKLRAEREAAQAELRAQRAEIERQRLEFEQARAAAAEAARKAEEAAKPPVQETPAEPAPAAEPKADEPAYPAPAVPLWDRPSDNEIINALCQHFRARESAVIGWLLDMDLDRAGSKL
jgi:colicin import membrane protein